MDFLPATSNDVLKVICVLLPKTTICPWQKTIDNIEHSWEKTVFGTGIKVRYGIKGVNNSGLERKI